RALRPRPARFLDRDHLRPDHRAGHRPPRPRRAALDPRGRRCRRPPRRPHRPLARGLRPSDRAHALAGLPSPPPGHGLSGLRLPPAPVLQPRRDRLRLAGTRARALHDDRGAAVRPRRPQPRALPARLLPRVRPGVLHGAYRRGRGRRDRRRPPPPERSASFRLASTLPTQVMRAAALTSAHIAPELLDAYADLDGAKREIIGHDEGPLLVIAGPGSGKTFCLVLRTVNLLLTGRAKPSELIVCTFTEKAAFELRDRIAEAARRVEYTGDLSELHVSTIHGLCNRILLEFRHHTPLGAGHETLDELTELLFLFDHFGDIVEGDSPYFGKWSTKWRAIEGMRDYFDKITEELVDPIALRACSDPFVAAIGAAYERYQAKLFERNRVDFAHLQALVHGLLADAAIGPAVAARFRYVLVDEYQDTNYVQEQVLTKLASATRNLCVVGDEDQSLYRFRGATVRNILEFPKSFPDCKRVDLTTNYRSHEKIVRAY